MNIRLLFILVTFITCSSALAEEFEGYEMTLNGSAALVSGDSVLRVAPVGIGNSGSAFITQSYGVFDRTSFSVFFQFRIGDGSGADGMAFVVQNNSAGANAIGGAGGGIGYSSMSESVAVEMDTYYNSSWDPDENHVGINLEGNLTSATDFTPGADLNSGASQYMWVDYNGAFNELSVYYNTTNSKPGSPNTTLDIDLFDQIGGNAYVGFTAATGGGTDNHDIEDFSVNWSSNDRPVPAMSAWSRSLMVMLVLALAGGFLVVRARP
jgi:hypothetical protein